MMAVRQMKQYQLMNQVFPNADVAFKAWHLKSKIKNIAINTSSTENIMLPEYYSDNSTQ